MTRKSIVVVMVIAGSMVVGAGGICAGQDAYFDEGNQLYQSGDFRGALERYTRIIETGYESGDLYYNIGNAHFKLGQLGLAILFYERAHRLMPGDDDVRANLELARSLTIDQVVPLPRFWLFRAVEWWVGVLPGAALAWLVGVSYLVLMATIVTLILRPPDAIAAWGRRLAAASAVVTIVFGINLTVRELGLGVAEEAVITVEEATVQSAPSDDSTLQLFTVHEGTKVRLDRRSDEWIEIVLEDGTVGWVHGDQLEPI